jgi:hypothetical protein
MYIWRSNNPCLGRQSTWRSPLYCSIALQLFLAQILLLYRWHRTWVLWRWVEKNVIQPVWCDCIIFILKFSCHMLYCMYCIYSVLHVQCIPLMHFPLILFFSLLMSVKCNCLYLCLTQSWRRQGMRLCNNDDVTGKVDDLLWLCHLLSLSLLLTLSFLRASLCVTHPLYVRY